MGKLEGVTVATCPHGIAMTQTCRECGRWAHEAQPWRPGPEGRDLILAYLDHIAESLLLLTERAGALDLRRRAEYERLHEQSAPQRGGVQ